MILLQQQRYFLGSDLTSRPPLLVHCAPLLQHIIEVPIEQGLRSNLHVKVAALQYLVNYVRIQWARIYGGICAQCVR